MRIFHRITVTTNRDIQRQLRRLGIEVEEGFVTFEIDESNASWPELEPMLSLWHAVDVAATKFSERELREATSLRMASSWHYGYPQPQEDFGYLSASYDLAEYCAECGIGKRQVAPLRMRGEPKWGRRHMLQLNWIFDEFLVLPDLWKSTFEPMGVPCVPVIDHRTDKILQTAVQLDIATAASVLELNRGQAYEVCPRCERRKYLPISKGMFPRLVDPQTGHIQKTREFFGSGASAWKAIIVSSEFFERIVRQHLKGVEFAPCIHPM